GVFCATGLASGANQLSCEYRLAIISLAAPPYDWLAIISLAASPYDCQAKVAETPMQKIIRKRTTAIKARLPNDDRPFGYLSFFRSAGRIAGASAGMSNRLAGNESTEGPDCGGFGTALICTSRVPALSRGTRFPVPHAEI